MMKKLKTSNGITLIALVVTIIVLLILAGVAISTLSGENGIINKANQAKGLTEFEQLKEQLSIDILAEEQIRNDNNIPQDRLEELLGKYGNVTKDEDGNITGVETDKGYIDIADVYDGGQGQTNPPTPPTPPVEEKTVAKLKEEQHGEAVTENTEAKDTDGDKIVIPKNFNIADESPTEIEEGIVIEDSDDNQYVWIPVFEKSTSREWGVDYTAVKSETEGTENYYKVIETALKKYTETYADSSCSDVWYQAKHGYVESEKTVYYSNGNMTQEQYTTLYHNMLKSVYKSGGFYIGRYEMGKAVVSSVEEAKTNTRTSSNTEYTGSSSTPSSNQKPTIGEAPVSKANAVPYNYITQSQAEMLAEKLGEGDDYKDSVYTSIMFGVQWDAVCVFIENYDTNNEKQPKSSWLKNSDCGKLWGNNSNSTYKMDRGYYTTNSSSTSVTWNEASEKSSGDWLCTTGASEQNKSLNIYDFEGNVGEWTLEMYYSNSDSPCVVNRGDNFNHSYYASTRIGSSTYFGTYNDSSRPTLYIK